MQSQTQQQVEIDITWLNNSSNNNPTIDLTYCKCFSCKRIVMSQPAQCNQCKKIFCPEDFNKVKFSKNKCPNCTVSPFIKSNNPHPIVVKQLKQLKFECKLCPKNHSLNTTQCPQSSQSSSESEDQVTETYSDEDDSVNSLKYTAMRKKPLRPLKEKKENKTKVKKVEYKIEQPNVKIYSREELCCHILTAHNVCVVGYGFGYEFEFTFDSQEQKPIKLSKCQNLDINMKLLQFKKNPNMKSFTYHLSSNVDLVINFSREQVEKIKKNKPGVKGKITKQASLRILKNVDYELWSVNINNVDHYYKGEYQKTIIEQYKKYQINKNYNELVLDIKDHRYRIQFNRMKQINTTTKFERPIKMITVRLKD